MEQISTKIKEALDILGLPTLITRGDIKKQYRFLAKKYHPDQGGNTEDMEKINQAYQLLIHYIEDFRYTFDDEEISRQFPGADHAQRFKP
jgi:DnaJ-class molecular chaperone